MQSYVNSASRAAEEAAAQEEDSVQEAISASILHTWERISLPMLHTPMKLTQIGMQTLVQQIMSPGS
jgi:hypothetical protein